MTSPPEPGPGQSFGIWFEDSEDVEISGNIVDGSPTIGIGGRRNRRLRLNGNVIGSLGSTDMVALIAVVQSALAHDERLADLVRELRALPSNPTRGQVDEALTRSGPSWRARLAGLVPSSPEQINAWVTAALSVADQIS